MLYQLPPAGERARLSPTANADQWLAEHFRPFAVRLFDSGTSALAASLVAAVARAGVAEPEVLLPAYGCPDLVSAVLHAGARPVLVDLAVDRPWMDLDRLKDALGPRTVAVVAVDLFGIPERYNAIRAALAGSKAVLVQDSAQALPAPQERPWAGDLVVLSFGRGKPVSLLAGGAVLARDPGLATLLPTAPDKNWGTVDALRLQAGLVAYNLLLSARLYWIPASLPFLGLGETRFFPHPGIGAVPTGVLRLLPVNIQAHWDRGRRPQQSISAMVAAVGDTRVLDLPAACVAEGSPVRLLRYPILVRDETLRNGLQDCLRRSGLGVSGMYPCALPQLPGLEGQFLGASYPNAERFAREILTLPVHSRVRERDVRAMGGCFAASLPPPA